MISSIAHGSTAVRSASVKSAKQSSSRRSSARNPSVLLTKYSSVTTASLAQPWFLTCLLSELRGCFGGRQCPTLALPRLLDRHTRVARGDLIALVRIIFEHGSAVPGPLQHHDGRKQNWRQLA